MSCPTRKKQEPENENISLLLSGRNTSFPSTFRDPAAKPHFGDVDQSGAQVSKVLTQMLVFETSVFETFRTSIFSFSFSGESHCIWKKPLGLRVRLSLTRSCLCLLPPSLGWVTPNKELRASWECGRLELESQVCYWLSCCLRQSPAKPERVSERWQLLTAPPGALRREE